MKSGATLQSRHSPNPSFVTFFGLLTKTLGDTTSYAYCLVKKNPHRKNSKEVRSPDTREIPLSMLVYKKHTLGPLGSSS